MIKLTVILNGYFASIHQGGKMEISSNDRSVAPLLGRGIELVSRMKQHLSFQGLLVTSMLLLLVVLSAIGVVYSSHLSRQLFTEQAILLEKNDQMQLEWAQLLLEQSAWSSPGRIEIVAGDELGMTVPKTKDMQLIY